MDMNHATHNASIASGGISVGTGLITFFGDNANAIGAMVAVTSLFFTVLFMVLNYRLNHLKTKANAKRDALDKLLSCASQTEREIIMSVLERE